MESEKDVPSCIIQEALAPPQLSIPVASNLIQFAIEFHNSGQYKKALDSFNDARRLWRESGSDSSADGEMYFLVMQGSVCLSMRKEQEGLQRFMLAKQYSDIHFGDNRKHLSHSLVLGCIGCAYAYMLRFGDALTYFKKALHIRHESLGDDHVDTATLRNNVAVCMASSEPIAASREEIINHLTAAHKTMFEHLGPNHPRTATVFRNLNRERSRTVLKYSAALPPLSKLNI